ncbi:uncharacterized protein LOC144607896 [Rhinoraja longicauda]
MTIIVPVPKNSKIECLDNYYPVALTFTIMKFFKSQIFFNLLLICQLSQVTACDKGEYKHNGTCCPLCSAGDAVAEHCTVDSGIRCSRCPLGEYIEHPNGLEKCFKCKTCDDGSGLQIEQECTPTRNTICKPKKGYYCKETNCAMAKMHSTCPAGHGVKEKGTQLNDTVCEMCPAGTFSSNNSSTEACMNCTAFQKKTRECGSGLQIEQECTPTRNTICKPKKGYYCKETNCAMAKMHSTCPAGHGVKEKGTQLNDTMCEMCPAGTFSSNNSSTEACMNCTAFQKKTRECGSGLQIEQECTPTRNTICKPKKGYYCKETNCAMAKMHSTCPAGHGVKEKGTQLNDTMCEMCPAGTFSSNNSSTEACMNCTACDKVHRQLLEPGSSEADVKFAKANNNSRIIIPFIVVPVIIFILIGAVVFWRYPKLRPRFKKRRENGIGRGGKPSPAGNHINVNDSESTSMPLRSNEQP